MRSAPCGRHGPPSGTLTVRITWRDRRPGTGGPPRGGTTGPAAGPRSGPRRPARPGAGHGGAAAGDHLQLGWAFWLVGHQLERRASPFADPYSFRPEAEAPPSPPGRLFALPPPPR